MRTANQMAIAKMSTRGHMATTNQIALTTARRIAKPTAYSGKDKKGMAQRQHVTVAHSLTISMSPEAHLVIHTLASRETAKYDN